MEEILHQLICSLSHYSQGFIHPRWCKISAIKSMSSFFSISRIVHHQPYAPITHGLGVVSLDSRFRFQESLRYLVMEESEDSDDMPFIMKG